MSHLRRMINKVITGIAAFLLTCLQALGSVDMSYVMMPYGYAYTWTDHGIRATMMQEELQAREAEEQQRKAQEHLYMANLEGAVYEDRIRTAARPVREGQEAAS